MSPQRDRRKQPLIPPNQVAGLVFLLIAAGLVGLVWFALSWGSDIAGVNRGRMKSLGTLLNGLIHHKITWPVASTVILAVAVVLILVVLFVSLDRWSKHVQKKRSRVDSAARLMGTGRDVSGISARNARESTARIAPEITVETIGVPIGRSVATNLPLFATFEDTHVDIWGPRTGKTTSRAIPCLLDAPGAVLCTSNKRDLADATRDIRADVGVVRVFDPQGIVGDEPTWWWNPLSYVVDDTTALKLAEHFASGSKEPDSTPDAYFDPKGQAILAAYLLAASLDRRPITDVYLWLTRTNDTTAADILNDNDYRVWAGMIESALGYDAGQRDGIFGSAEKMVASVTIRKIARWVTPLGGNVTGDRRPQFDPAAFVRSRDTLYMMSKEGPGTATALVTALTAAVVEEGEKLAERSRLGRMPVPLMAILDEAANVCRWKELPNLYSHFGSKGIIPMTILQSPSQGIAVWGKEGMKKLWSAANVKTYGGGVDDMEWLEERSKSIGDFERRFTTASGGGAGNRSTSEHRQMERILTADELQALPKGRAIVWSSGNRAALARTVPWMAGPHAERVKASILAHDPAAEQTLRDAETELASVLSREAAGSMAPKMMDGAGL